MSARTRFLALVAAVAAIAVGLVVAGLEGGPGITDTPVYRTYGERIASGDVPYRDFVSRVPAGCAGCRSSLPALVIVDETATTRPSRR